MQFELSTSKVAPKWQECCDTLYLGSLICLLFYSRGENIESYLKSELLLQHGSRQALRAKITMLAGASFENKPELSLAQDGYLSQ